MILHFSLYSGAPGSVLQRIPDFEQNSIAVFPPLMIPKTQFLNALRLQKILPSIVLQMLLWQAVLKPIQFDR